MRILIITLFLLSPAYLVYLIALYLRTRVPYVVTPRRRLPLLFAHLRITPETVIYDLGCGKGDVLFAAEKYGAKKIIGFELSPLHAWYAQLKALLLRSEVRVRRQDFFLADIGEADIIYLFLVQSMVDKLWPKIKKEAKRGATIVVLCNKIPDIEPAQVLLPVDEEESGAKVYLYRI